MVKEVTLNRTVPGYTPQAYFNAIYQGSSCTKRYHQEVSNAPDAAITAWANNRRTIQFSMHVEAPAFLKRIVGVDSAKVTETQTVTFNADGIISLRSVPVPNIPGGDKFTTQIDTLLAPSSDGSSCLVQAKVSCKAAGPYGLTGAIEGFMAEQARAGLQKWMDFTDRYLAEAAAAGAVSPVTVEVEAFEGVDEFFDAQDLPLPGTAAAGAGLAARGVAPGKLTGAEGLPTLPNLPTLSTPPGLGDLVPSTPLSFEETLLLYLRYMCRTGDQTCVLLDSLDRRLRSLEQHMALIQSAVVLPANGNDASQSEYGRTAGGQPPGQQQQQQQGDRWQQQNGHLHPAGQWQQQQQQHQAHEPHQQGGSLLGRPVTLRRALIGAGLLATGSAAVTALVFRRRQQQSFSGWWFA
ncbi:hypothetical protein N2152v2_005051 [Parachlorella kessleri]